MHTASQALAIERQASAQPSLAERVSRPKTRAILGLMRLNFLSVTTPVAIVHNASLPTQRHAVCTLGELQTTIAREGLASPSVIVVGDVMQGLLAAAQVPEREPLGQTRTA